MTKSRTAKFNIEQIGLDEDVLFNLMTHDAKYDFYALRPDEVTELQNSIKAIIDDRDRLKQANAAQLEACKAVLAAYLELNHMKSTFARMAAIEKVEAVIDAASEAN